MTRRQCQALETAGSSVAGATLRLAAPPPVLTASGTADSDADSRALAEAGQDAR